MTGYGLARRQDFCRCTSRVSAEATPDSVESPTGLLDDFFAAHIRPQNFRNDNRTVGLLIVFYEREELRIATLIWLFYFQNIFNYTDHELRILDDYDYIRKHFLFQ